MKKRKISECLYHPFNQNKKNKRWTLLFVGDRGRTITFKRFKGLVICVSLAFIISSALTFWFYYLYRSTAMENQKMENDLDNIRKVVMSLRDEKDILMARLIVTESRAEKNKPESQSYQPDSILNLSDTSDSTHNSKPEEEKESVSINGFVIYHEPDMNTLRVQYKINNTTPKNKPVTGKTVVVIKDNSKDPRNWLILPAVRLKSGRPSGQKGKYFSISYFKTMKHRVNNQRNPDQFNTAVVYVFSKTGELLSENSYPVGIKLKTIQTSRKPKSKPRTAKKRKKPSKRNDGSVTSSGGSPTSETNANQSSTLTPASKKNNDSSSPASKTVTQPRPADNTGNPASTEDNAEIFPIEEEKDDNVPSG